MGGFATVIRAHGPLPISWVEGALEAVKVRSDPPPELSGPSCKVNKKHNPGLRKIIRLFSKIYGF